MIYLSMDALEAQAFASGQPMTRSSDGLWTVRVGRRTYGARS